MLTIINSIAIFLIVIVKIVFNIKDRVSFDWHMTTWEKKKYGFNFTLWEYKKSEAKFHGFNSGKGFFNFNWRDPKKLSDDIKKSKH